MSNLGLTKDEIVNLNGSLNTLGETIKTSISNLEESFKPLSGCLDEICGQLSEINTGLESLGSSEGLTSFGEGLNIVLGMIVAIFDLIRDAGGIKKLVQYSQQFSQKSAKRQPEWEQRFWEQPD